MKKFIFHNDKVGLTPKELALFQRLDTPEKIQTFVSNIPHNFEPDGDSCMSVRETLQKNRALCMEGALVAALALWINGDEPLILDLSAEHDDDHVIALFRRHGAWGAISKSNHSYVRYRDPIYRSLRELVMSYVHEYYNERGEKSLRSYGGPVRLVREKPEDWITGAHAWQIADKLCVVRHYPLMTKSQSRTLRPIEPIEKKLFAIRAFEPGVAYHTRTKI